MGSLTFAAKDPVDALPDMGFGGIKHDESKARYDLIPHEVLEAMAEALGFGAEKYDDHNYRKGLPYSRLFASLQRHLWAWWSGEPFDEESQLHPLSHACACLAMLAWTVYNRPDLDDRWKDE